MMEAERGVSFPVVFSYGKTETNIGDLVVYPKLDFPWFLSVLSHKIRILLGQLTVFLSSLETCQQIPIIGKVNFNTISREELRLPCGAQAVKAVEESQLLGPSPPRLPRRRVLISEIWTHSSWIGYVWKEESSYVEYGMWIVGFNQWWRLKSPHIG
ncbi:hypothetical protein PS2_031841 [Malus domestica]